MSSTIASVPPSPQNQTTTIFYLDPGLLAAITLGSSLVITTILGYSFLTKIQQSIRDGDNQLKDEINRNNAELKSLIAEMNFKVDRIEMQSAAHSEIALLKLETKAAKLTDIEKRTDALENKVDELRNHNKSS